MTARYCGWEIPGFPVYVCIRESHADNDHDPLWLTNDQRAALAKLRRWGLVDHPSAPSPAEDGTPSPPSLLLPLSPNPDTDDAEEAGA